MDESKEARIVEINRAIIQSYTALGGINHPNLPSRRGVVSILSAFESLIFPGYQMTEELGEPLIPYTIGVKTQQLVRDMTVEISRGLEYASRLDGNRTPTGACMNHAETISLKLLAAIPRLRELAMSDVEAAFRGDPAAKSHEEIILAYPGIIAVVCHRIAHEFHMANIPLIPRMMSEYVHGQVGIDIHPGAQIGTGFFIDHGTGVVIGETAIIGQNVKLYQGVTIGALSVTKELADKKRHPTLEDNVTIYSGATILGGKTVIGENAVIGGNMWITESIPPHTIVSNTPAGYRMKTRNGGTAVHDWII